MAFQSTKKIAVLACAAPECTCLTGNGVLSGGSSGIGVALVKAFAALGDEVWFTYNSGKQRADEILRSLDHNAKAKVRLPARQLAHRSLADSQPGTFEYLRIPITWTAASKSHERVLKY